MNQRTASRHQRRRRSQGRRLAVHGLARALRQSGRDASPRARRRRSRPRRKELGYRPNVAARALRTGVARSVALVVPDITNPFFGRVLRGAQRAAQQRRLHRRAGRHRQRSRLGGREPAGAARRARRRPAAVRGRAPAGRDRARDPDRDAPGQAARRAPRRRGGRGLRARPPARARAHADRPRRLELRRAHLRPAPRSDPGAARRRHAHGARAVHVRRRRRGRRHAARRRAASPRSSATTTSSPAASISRRATGASGSRRT